MTHSISDELISAWLDDELTQSESQAVQTAIDTDSDVARRANELRILSGVLKSLPIERVPHGFHELVISATQKTVQDPVAPQSTTGQSTSRPSTQKPSRNGWWIPVGLVSSAALLLVSLNWNDDGVERLSMNTVDATLDVEEMAPEGISDELLTRSEFEFGGGNMAAAKTLNTPPALVAADSAMNVASSDSGFSNSGVGGGGGAGYGGGGFSRSYDGAEVANSDSDSQADRKSNVATTIRRTLDPTQLKFERPVTDYDVGEVVSAIDQSGDNVSVVKLTVVDRNASVGRLEVLLAVHPGTSVGTTYGGMIMIEAMPEQLAECFRKLQEEDLCESIAMASNSVAYLDVAVESNSTAKSGRAAPSGPARRINQARIAAIQAPQIAADEPPKATLVESRMAADTGAETGVKVQRNAAVAMKSAPQPAMAADEEMIVSSPGRTDRTRLQKLQQKPVRLLIVLEPSADAATGEGSGSIIDFRAYFGPMS